ncbi:hypothetical protein PENTCL1PPCAC_25526, partial [Pristionchus entomophagus]
LRHALSDHSLYKPSFNCFMKMWNEDDRRSENEQLLNVQRLALAFSMREKEMLEQDHASLSEVSSDDGIFQGELREIRKQEKRARRERRRNSVLISLQAQEEEHALTLPRASSTPDIRPLRLKSKRVAFALEPLTLPKRYGDAVKPLPPINRPILVKKRKISCLPPSEVPYIDYETFAAWRRGALNRRFQAPLENSMVPGKFQDHIKQTVIAFPKASPPTVLAITTMFLMHLVTICIACAMRTYSTAPLDNSAVPGPYKAHMDATVMAFPKAAAEGAISTTVLALTTLLSRMSLDVAMQEQILAHHKALKAKMEAERKRKSFASNLADVLKQCFFHRSPRTSPVNW